LFVVIRSNARWRGSLLLHLNITLVAKLSHLIFIHVIVRNFISLIGFYKFGNKKDVEKWLNDTETPGKNGQFNSLDVTGFGGCKKFLDLIAW
jgi:hypothetical protein